MRIDSKTLLVALFIPIGQAILFFNFASFPHPEWSVFLLAIVLMNLSFTAWHEAAHGNFSDSPFANHLLGVFSSIFTLGPGYFYRRREHLAHHRFEGEEKFDPVYPRVQCRPYMFPLRLLWQSFIPPSGTKIPKDFMPATWSQYLIDAALISIVIALSMMGITAGFGQQFIWIWFYPRIFIFFFHAFYICYFPHSLAGGGYVVSRNHPSGAFLKWLTMGQNLHGFHHKNPSTPWHSYRAE